MKKKIDRCKYNISNLRDYDKPKPFCAWHCMGGLKKEDYESIVPPHITLVTAPSADLTDDICKNCKCFEPIARS